MTVQELIDSLSAIQDKQQEIKCCMSFWESQNKYYDVYSIYGVTFLENEKKFYLDIRD